MEFHPKYIGAVKTNTAEYVLETEICVAGTASMGGSTTGSWLELPQLTLRFVPDGKRWKCMYVPLHNLGFMVPESMDQMLQPNKYTETDNPRLIHKVASIFMQLLRVNYRVYKINSVL